ncbi:MAG TPA: polysaccharide deacetylase family protein [Candidatus Saccharimonadia bacterium]|jgi:peptidoglycan/xylan/chitin deacetylase (PgdA/CDA1 family)|nr:polysaccharide deacetylase family protein [Candidatus Saccharimonadia bacterium]
MHRIIPSRSQIRRWVKFGGVAFVFAGSVLAVVLAWPHPVVGIVDNRSYPVQLRTNYAKAVQSVRDFQRRQAMLHARVASDHQLRLLLSNVQLDAASGHYATAEADIRELRQALTNWNFELNGGSGGATAQAQFSIQLPILLYHYPPPNFEEQLAHLEQAGYTTIDLDQALDGLHGGALPAKPVVITFDDGFAAQMQAFELLKRHHMKATFYIIDGGEASKWCIGAGRRYGDPLQPPGGCGDAYLSWDQVRTLDKSGLITIGGHTVNHRNLATLSAADQEFEIVQGKELLEAELGHSVHDFAYPYGAYNAESIKLAQEAGYTTAVTTMEGTVQTDTSIYTLRRVRDALLLP